MLRHGHSNAAPAPASSAPPPAPRKLPALLVLTLGLAASPAFAAPGTADEEYTPIFVAPPVDGELVDVVPVADTFPLDEADTAQEAAEETLAPTVDVAIEDLPSAVVEPIVDPAVEASSLDTAAEPVDEATSQPPATALPVQVMEADPEPAVSLPAFSPEASADPDTLAEPAPAAAVPSQTVEPLIVPPEAVVTHDVEFQALLPSELFDFQSVFYPLWSAGYTTYRAELTCKHRDDLLEAGKKVARAPMFEMTKGDFDSWRKTSKALAASVEDVHKACEVEEGAPLAANAVNDRLIVTRDLWVTLLKVRKE